MKFSLFLEYHLLEYPTYLSTWLEREGEGPPDCLLALLACSPFAKRCGTPVR
jgi:hypothetical protein